MTKDTIFALSSGRPPAAVSIIRVSGPQAHEAGRQIAGSLPEARKAAVRELRDPRHNDVLDEALVLRFDSPASSTGENIVEFQCHGGRAVVDAVLAALTSLKGLRLALPGEFTRRAFENGRIDLTEAEGLADLIEAETQSQRKAALTLAEGGLRKRVAEWQERLLSLSAAAELAIDYDEDDDGIDPKITRQCEEMAFELRSWLEQPRVEKLKDGVRVVIAGPPNAGKSSLLNVLSCEERAIVTETPGTTRDHIEVPLSLGGVPILLTDTAGLRESCDEVEAIGVERSVHMIGAADVLLWLGDEGAPDHPRTIAVHAKADLAERQAAPKGSVSVSSVSGLGIVVLLQEIERAARTLVPADDALTLNRRQAKHIAEATDALERGACETEVVLLAEELRHARSAFDRLTGRAGVENVLDALFSRFCLGK